MTDQRVNVWGLRTRQLRNLELIHREKCPVIVAGDKVRVRIKFIGFARCYQFKAANFTRIIGEVTDVRSGTDGYTYAEVDFCQRQLKKRPDGKFYGENAEPSRFEIGVALWPLEMLEIVK